MQKDFYRQSSQSALTEVDVSGAQEEFVNQQEKVLTCQASLKVQLQHYHNTKKNLITEFERFCNEKYKTVLVDFEEAELVQYY